MKKFVVFDLDGTLVESLPGIAEGLNRALVSVGCAPHPVEAVRGMIGRGAENLCAAALGYADAAEAPPAELAALHQAFRREYPRCWQGRGTLPYAGVEELLARLVAAGARVAILSNKPHEVTEVMVGELFPSVPFCPVLGHAGRFPRKPAPDALLHIASLWEVEAAALTLVGDSLYDARTAANAGAGCVLVDWGYADSEDLRARGACPVVASVVELEELLLGTQQQG